MFNLLIVILVWCSLLGSAINFVPSLTLWQEINRNCGSYYLALHLLTLVVLLFPAFEDMRFRRAVYLVLSCLCVFYAVHIYPFYVWPEDPLAETCTTQDPCLKFTSLFGHYPAAEGARAELQSIVETEQPNVLALVGAPQNLPDFYARYRFQIRAGEDLVLLSTYPLEGAGKLPLGEDVPGALMVDLVLQKGRNLQLTLVDALPLEGDALAKNKLITRRLLTPLKHNDREGILFGSLHVTPFSNYYGIFLWAAKFQNAAEGFGLWHTWDGTSLFKRFALDHVFVRGVVRVVDYRVLRLDDSPHMPVLVEFETPRRLSTPWVMPADED